MGIVYQLSVADCCKDYINTTGFAFGSGAYSKLLGFNVIGTGAAWALMFITLLENSSGSQVFRLALYLAVCYTILYHRAQSA
jgi:hypothetical protein